MMSARSLTLLAIAGATLALCTPMHAAYLAEQKAPVETCSTDTDCMDDCRADEPDCDGGPEPVQEAKPNTLVHMTVRG